MTHVLGACLLACRAVAAASRWSVSTLLSACMAYELSLSDLCWLHQIASFVAHNEHALYDYILPGAGPNAIQQWFDAAAANESMIQVREYEANTVAPYACSTNQAWHAGAPSTRAWCSAVWDQCRTVQDCAQALPKQRGTEGGMWLLGALAFSALQPN